MARMLMEWMQALASIPRPVWAILAGLLVSWLATQRLKFLVPDTIEPWLRHRAVQVLAFMLAFAVTTLVWGIHPTEDGAQAYRLNLDGLVAAFLVGLGAPFAYWLVVRLLSMKWPGLRARLSQDERSDP